MPFDPRTARRFKRPANHRSVSSAAAAALTEQPRRSACVFAPPAIPKAIPATLSGGCNKATLARVLLRFAEAGETITTADSIEFALESTIKSWISKHLVVASTLHHYIVVHYDTNALDTDVGYCNDELSPDMPALAWVFVHENAEANVIDMKRGVEHLEALHAGLGASVLYAIDALCAEPYYAWSNFDFWQEAIQRYWEGETTDSAVTGVLLDTGQIEAAADTDHWVMPRDFTEHMPLWACDRDALKAACLSRTRLRQIAGGSGPAAQVAIDSLRAHRLYGLHASRRVARDVWRYHNGDPPPLHAYFLRWNEEEVFGRLFDDMQNERMQGEGTDITAVTQIPVDPDKFTTWKKAMEWHFKRATCVDRLITTVATIGGDFV